MAAGAPPTVPRQPSAAAGHGTEAALPPEMAEHGSGDVQHAGGTGDTGGTTTATAVNHNTNDTIMESTNNTIMNSTINNQAPSTRRSFVIASLPCFMRTYLQDMVEAERHMYEVR
jgi:hypothetical protein